MSTTAFFVTLCDHYTPRQRQALILQRLYSKHRSVGRIAVISASSPVQFILPNNRSCRCQAFQPTREWRLFVVVTVKEKSLLDLSRYHCEDNRT